MNIAEILKNCPKGTKLYSPIFGELEFDCITSINYICCNEFVAGYKKVRFFLSDGKFDESGEIMLFPSKECKNWDNCRLAKFDISSLKPYDKVLIKEEEDGCWVPTLISYVTTSEVFVIEKNDPVEYVIPYEPNKHLVGKFEDPDKYYITW